LVRFAHQAVEIGGEIGYCPRLFIAHQPEEGGTVILVGTAFTPLADEAGDTHLSS